MSKWFPWPSSSEPSKKSCKDDTDTYRKGYPGKKDNKHLNDNLKFYQGHIPFQPHGDYIDKIHQTWYDNLDRIEGDHNYIQWLFPTREQGVNPQAQELQPHEAEAIRNDPSAIKRFVESYKMMLHFFGMKIVDYDTGEVARADNWSEQFASLNHSEHNYLRITRILKSLGEMGLERYKYPFLKFMLTEAIKTKELWNTLESCNDYWIPTVKDDTERKMLMDYRAKLVSERSKPSERGRHSQSNRGEHREDSQRTPKQNTKSTAVATAASRTHGGNNVAAGSDSHSGKNSPGTAPQPEFDRSQKPPRTNNKKPLDDSSKNDPNKKSVDDLIMMSDDESSKLPVADPQKTSFQEPSEVSPGMTNKMSVADPKKTSSDDPSKMSVDGPSKMSHNDRSKMSHNDPCKMSHNDPSPMPVDDASELPNVDRSKKPHDEDMELDDPQSPVGNDEPQKRVSPTATSPGIARNTKKNKK